MKKLISFLPGGSIFATILLILLLIVPFKVYEFISSGTNNFVKLAIIGDENHKIPSYKFINQNSDTIDNSHYDDHIYIADFFFTRCPTICPVMTYNMKYIQKELSIYPNIKFLSHTVDPENDTPEVLKDYVKSMRINDRNSIALLIWILSRDINAIKHVSEGKNIRSLGIWENQVQWYQKISTRIAPKTINKLIDEVNVVDRKFKGVLNGDPWNGIKDIVLSLSA